MNQNYQWEREVLHGCYYDDGRAKEQFYNVSLFNTSSLYISNALAASGRELTDAQFDDLVNGFVFARLFERWDKVPTVDRPLRQQIRREVLRLAAKQFRVLR